MTVGGEQIGAYRMISRLGAGGMGEVWLAEHVLLGRRAAIKLLHPAFSQQPEIVTRFFNEARAATAIADPGIVQIFDFGHHHGSAYIVMELLDGETLDARWRRLGAVPLDDAVRIVRQVASSLGAAHARGIVHRDLKPENIFLVRDPEVPGGERAKILDFGIAKLGGDAHLKTSTSAVMGTPHYMSPEQCRGAGQVDQRSDIYALGCVLFTIVVGRPPFDANGAGELFVMHLREPAPRAASCATGIPSAIDDLIARCLGKDPAQRYGSGSQLADALDALTTNPGAPHRAVVAVAAMPTTLSGAASHQIRTPARRFGPLVVAGTATLVIAGLGVRTVIRSTKQDAPVQLAAVPPAGDSLPASPPLAPSPVIPAPAPPLIDAPPAPPSAEPALRAALTAFATWAKTHAGAACPHADTLAAITGDAHALDDPWGHAVAITCSDQPADQVAGAISAGPDGQLGSDDDVASWTLGRAVTAVVKGAHWHVSATPHSPLRPQTSPVVVPVAHELPAAHDQPRQPDPSDFERRLREEREKAKKKTVKVEAVQ